MISYGITAQTDSDYKFSFKGLSTDTKPTGEYLGKPIANTSTFFEMDTQDVYFYDGGTNAWLAQP